MKCVEITLVIGCPNKCSYCPQEVLLKNYKGNRIMPYEPYKKLLEKIPNETDIHFSGFGEPCTHPDIVRLSRHTVEKGHALTFFTTLIGCSLNQIKQLKEIKVKDFVVHLINEKESQAKLDEAYYKKLYYVASFFPKVTFITTDKTPKKTLKYIKKRNNQPLNKISRGGLLFKNKTENKKIWCPNTEQQVLVPNGDMYACCMDFGLKHKLGNLFTQSIKDIEKGKEKTKFLKEMENKKIPMCNNCENARAAFFGCKKVFFFRNILSVSIFKFKKIMKGFR